MHSAPDPQNTSLTMSEARPAIDNITHSNIKPSPSIGSQISAQPKVLMLFEDVRGVLPAVKRYEYQEAPNVSVPGHVLELWRSRGFDPSSTGISIVNFLEDGKKSKAYTFPLYFWEAV